tara:strand:- start:1298 stop:1579 length:282 start_codon:yes stop_codon:yes gene_type:complete
MNKKIFSKYWRRSILKTMVRDKRLSPTERLGTRVGYMGVGFLVAGQWTLSPPLYVMGFGCVLIQVAIRRQWNLVILQLNGLVAWTIHFIKSIL